MLSRRIAAASVQTAKRVCQVNGGPCRQHMPLFDAQPFGTSSRRHSQSDDSSSSDGASTSRQTLDQMSPSSGPFRAQTKRKGKGAVPLFTARTTGIRTPRSPSVAGKQVDKTSSAESTHSDLDDLEQVAMSSSDPEAILFRTDRQLSTLVIRMNQNAQNNDAAGVVNACIGIKTRLLALAREKGDKAPIAPPLMVYHVLLKTISRTGDVDTCQEILADMQSVGKEVGVVELNLLLAAAVQQQDPELVDEILRDISLVSPTRHAWQRHTKEEDRAEMADDTVTNDTSDSTFPLISPAYTANWTPNTYQHLIRHCQTTNNLEYALALLGSASHRDPVQVPVPASTTDQESDRPRTIIHYLQRVLNVPTVRSLLLLVQATRQGRLMADLAAWLDDGMAARKLDVRTWMDVLRCCAEEDWFPGVALAWERAVQQGLLAPDQGLLQSVLRCAARNKQPDFLANALEVYIRYAPSGTVLQEWHLLPLMEAQAQDGRYEDAVRTASRVIRAMPEGNRSQQLFVMLISVGATSKRVCRQLYQAFIKVGRETTVDGGVATDTMNALIRAANSRGMHEMALKLYGARRFLHDEQITTSPSTTSSLPFPSFYADLGTLVDEVDDAGREAIRNTIVQIRDLEEAYKSQLNGHFDAPKADIGTFNALLSTAIDAESKELGEYVFAQINALRIRPDVITYERAVVLTITQERYEDAFSLLEECKMRRMQPTRATYMAIGMRCLREQDERWIGIGKEMIHYKYFPGHDIARALLDGQWISIDELKPFRQEIDQTFD